MRHMLRYESQVSLFSRDRIVVSTSRCGRDNPGSNPGHGKAPQGSSWLLADETFCYISKCLELPRFLLHGGGPPTAQKHGSFSRTHKIGNIANFVFPYLQCSSLFAQYKVVCIYVM